MNQDNPNPQPALSREAIYAAIGTVLSALTERMPWTPNAQVDLTVALLDYAAFSYLTNFVTKEVAVADQIKRFVNGALDQLEALKREGQS